MNSRSLNPFPSPWRLQLDPHGWNIYITDRYGAPICSVNWGKSDAQVENAILIKIAPDLLELAKKSNPKALRGLIERAKEELP
jgi:hypothetical protein